ncbi:hypothetical protein AB4Z22_00145 [Paenibacillus sp. TAF58]
MTKQQTTCDHGYQTECLVCEVSYLRSVTKSLARDIQHLRKELNITSSSYEAEVNCSQYTIEPGVPINHCCGSITFDHSKYDDTLLASNNGEFYEKIPCNVCGVVHKVIPWVVLTLDQKNQDGAYEHTHDYYIQPHHVGLMGQLKEVSEGKAEMPCPASNGCQGTITFNMDYSKDNLDKNDGEFYEHITCSSCDTSFKTVPWLAAVPENDRNLSADEKKHLAPAWIL